MAQSISSEHAVEISFQTLDKHTGMHLHTAEKRAAGLASAKSTGAARTAETEK
jgi:hypothetical protein